VTWPRTGGRDVALPPRELREVFLALLRNAAEACRSSGEVAVELEVEGGAVRIVVRDRGQGISSAVRHRLFEPGTTTKIDGSGFGLFLARRVVESAGGRLTAESPVEGGALFAVTLPIREG
jgi:signal transduction histidine kinase